jgi:hypothetical protein
MKDLFGNELTEAEAYALHKRKSTQPRGYAAPPGTGPKGETCRTCRHRAHSGGGARVYQKCLKNRHNWTHGPGTDILARAPACKFWEKKEGNNG